MVRSWRTGGNVRAGSGGVGIAALGVLDDLYRSARPGSHALASVIMGSTETLFYAVMVCLGSVDISNSRHIIPVCLLCLMVSIVVAGCCADETGDSKKRDYL